MKFEIFVIALSLVSELVAFHYHHAGFELLINVASHLLVLAMHRAPRP